MILLSCVTRAPLSFLQLYKTDIAFLSTRYNHKPSTGKDTTKGKRNKLLAEISPWLIWWTLETPRRQRSSIFYDIRVSSS